MNAFASGRGIARVRLAADVDGERDAAQKGHVHFARRRFRPADDSPRSRHEGVTYYFETEASHAAFLEDPEAYRLPGWKM